MENDKRISTNLTPKNLEPISFFEKDASFVFTYKKTEKLASAVYLVTNLFSNDEPMKWTLRKKVSELVSFIVSYKDVPQSGLSDFTYIVRTRVLELVSLLEVSSTGGLVSSMNFSILKLEFLNLLEALNVPESQLRELTSGAIAKAFFEVATATPTSSNNMSFESPSFGSSERSTFADLKEKNHSQENEILKRTNRQNIIIGLLKKKKELTIKDIALVIRDCSEKTIQRELISLISLGAIKRIGERRWSKYSLNN